MDKVYVLLLFQAYTWRILDECTVHSSMCVLARYHQTLVAIPAITLAGFAHLQLEMVMPDARCQ